MTLARRLLIGGAGSFQPASWNPAVSVTSSSTITAGGGSTDWVGRASIKRRPSDNALVLAYYRAEAHDTNLGALHLRFSDDDGATWTAEDTKLGGGAVSGFPMNPPTTSGTDAGEPWLYVCDNGDLLLHMWRINYGSVNGGTYQSRSTDGGETWSSAAGPIDWAGLTSDQDGRTYATDDDFVFGGTIYAGARVYVDASGDPAAVVLITSDDDGATWTRLATIVSALDLGGRGAQEVGLEYLGNDTIIAMIRDNPHTHSYQATSSNMGATWSALTDVTSTVGIAGRQRVRTVSHLKGEANWWNDPRLIMNGFIHRSSGSSHPRRNAIWLSQARGDTWDGPFYVDDETEDAGYGDMFWDATHSRYVYVSYQGSLTAASLKQYNLTITGI